MADEVLTARDGAVLTITLNRPDVYNAINRAMHEGLARRARRGGRSGGPRRRPHGRGSWLLLRAGSARVPSSSRRRAARRSSRPTTRTSGAIRALEKPVIAAINGAVRGRRALARVRVRRAHRLVRRELRPRLHRHRARARRGRHVVHPSAARLRPRVRVDGVEPPAERRRGARSGGSSPRWSRPSGSRSASRELAEWYAALPTRAVAMTKQLFEHAYTASLEEQLALEAELQQAATETEDFREGVQAFLEKRVADVRGVR